MSGTRIQAQAFLLGERLELRGLARAAGSGADPVMLRDGPGLGAFVFRWGGLVLFGATEAERDAMLRLLRDRISSPLDLPVEERAWIADGAARDDVAEGGEIQLIDFAPPRLALVAEAMAKSAALTHQEGELARTLDGMDPVVASLRRTGRLAIFSRRLLRMGDALAARSHATARVQAGDRPETLWEHAELERLHQRLAEEYELADRSAALDAKLVVIGETMQTLLSLIQGQRSQVLEIAVALFIGIEVVATLYGLLR
nr:RMD1 family protein [uncultured Roseococcus sp.]